VSTDCAPALKSEGQTKMKNKAFFLLFPLLLIATASVALGQSSDDCLMCHSDNKLTMTKQGQTIPLFVDGDRFKASNHSLLTCIACHVGFKPGEIPHAKSIGPVQCRTCHETPGFEQSVHAKAGCSSCHKPHEIMSIGDTKSVAVKTKQAELCLKCHMENSGIREKIGYSAAFIGSYRNSVHGMALAAGKKNAPTCSDCHGLHDAKKTGDLASRTNKGKIAETCSRCHENIGKEYSASVHGTSHQRGIADSPTCTDCHGDHQIQSSRDPRSRVAAKNIPEQVCGACHKSALLNTKFGIAQGKFDSFADSYHGLALKAGSVAAANCASCHGVHNILPSSDPASSVHAANLAATCGRCHPGANSNFAKGPVHLVGTGTASNRILYWIRIIYTCLIIVIIGGMLIHNFLDFLARNRHRAALKRGQITHGHHALRHYIRMNRNERIQHAFMFSSFILLAITGFMLRFPDAWWVRPIREISTGFFAARSLAHRIAGVAMVAISMYHLLYIFFTKRGRQFGLDMLPKWKDVLDVRNNLAYLLRLSKKKPLFDRFGYAEKAEYWALIWGVVVMAATGILMWFENYFIGLFTKLGWDISRTIHYYEAILATAAIVVWHFYFVIFNPDVYPMSTVWLNGKISEEEMAEEHPLELEKLKGRR
jgi:predicted CXXCH cytochrome family protein